jgi:chromosome segregation ATPase
MHTQTIAELSMELDRLQRAHEDLHDELERDREEAETIREIDRDKNLRMRNELDRLHEEIELLRKELQTERERNISLMHALNSEVEKSSQKTVQIVELRQQVESLAAKQKTITGDLKEVQRKTGKLEFPKE